MTALIPDLRVFVDLPADGPTNMARDEALLQLVGSRQSPPTLRFYRWEQATVSLGYFQPFAEFAALPPSVSRLAVVRRQTGGGAILHDLELTYSLTVPVDHPAVSGHPSKLYDRVHEAFAKVLRPAGVPVTSGPGGGGASHGGPFFCFQRHSGFDLLVNGRKLLGSAQRRTRQAVLQHGSLILDSRFPEQECATLAAYGAFDVDAALPQLAALIAGTRIEGHATWSEAELQLAAELRAKYAGDEWTRLR